MPGFHKHHGISAFGQHFCSASETGKTRRREGGNDGENKIGMDRRQITCLQIRDIAELTDGRIDAIAKLRIHFFRHSQRSRDGHGAHTDKLSHLGQGYLTRSFTSFFFGLPSASKLFTKITNRLKNKI